MLKLICNNNSTIDINSISNMNYSDLLKVECYFAIAIDDRIFFEEPLFPIYEFIYAYINWNKQTDFHYITLESEDNPLISFSKVDNAWYIDSPWKKFNCAEAFSLDELTYAIEVCCFRDR